MRSRFICLLIIIGFALSSCGQSVSEQSGAGTNSTWQEQYDLGMRYLTEENYAEAIIAFTAAIELDPKQALAYVGRGQAYIFSGETEGNLTASQTDFETALALDETIPDAWLGLADIFIRQGDYEKALEILQRGSSSTGGDKTIAEKIKEIEAFAKDSDAQYETEKYDFETEVVPDGLNVDAENLTVRVRDARSATITISGLSMKDSYLTNLSTSRENMAEFHWGVNMYGDQGGYSVSTSSWSSAPGEMITKSPNEMQKTVWVLEGNSFNYIGIAQMSYTSTSMTWSFTVPEEYPFDFADISRYEVFIEDVSLDMSIRRVYTLK